MKRIIILFTLLLATVTYAQMNMAEVSGLFNQQRVWNASVLSGGTEFTGMQLGPLTVGTAVFTTTATECTVAVTGAAVTDIYFITGKFTSAIDQQDILQYEPTATGFILHRMTAGESALGFSWLRIKTE